MRNKSRLLLAASATLAIVLSCASAAASYEATAWGGNGDGQLGNGSPFNGADFSPNEVPAPVIGLSEVIGLSAGEAHSLALLSNGTVMAWGLNSSGQLGNGTRSGPYECHPTVVHEYCNPAPEAVPGLSGVTAVAAGGDHSLALLNTGKLMGWGDNYFGELGDGTTESSDVPVAAGSGLTNVQAIATSYQLSFALTNSGQVFAWGSNKHGSLGAGENPCPGWEICRTPVAVSGVTSAKAIAPTIAALSSGTVVDWGPNREGELGDGATNEGSSVPVTVKGLSTATAVADGADFNEALLANGTVWAWGANWSGQLGDGSESGPESCEGNPCSTTPVEVTGLSGVRAIAASGSVSLALLNNGTVMTWGGGQDTPVPVCGLKEVSGLAAGEGFYLSFGPPHELCPTVTGVSPNHGPGIGKTSVTITGTNFAGASKVYFGSASADFTVDSSTSIVATAPKGGSGDVDITVTTPVGTSNDVEADRYQYEVGPAVTRVAPHQGPPSGGSEVIIFGANFTKVTSVDFGETPATKFKVESPTTITAVSPAGTGDAQITVSNDEGTSPVNKETSFSYTAAQAPEFGVCSKAKKAGTGQFLDANCTEEGSEGDYEWEPGPSRSTFSLTGSGSVMFETAYGYEITCSSFKGSGEFAGTKEVAGTTLTFKGCHLIQTDSDCETPHGPAGEIKEEEVEGVIGWQNKSAHEVALELGVELLGGGGTVELDCSYVSGPLSGGVLASLEANTLATKLPFEFRQFHGVQAIQSFEGGPTEQLQFSFDDSGNEPIGLSAEMFLKGGKLEVGTVR